MAKQVQAVVNAVKEVLGDSFTEGQTNVTDIITKDQKAEVREIVLKNIIEGNVDYKGSIDNPKTVRRYVNGMVDNHLRKSRLLNGGNVYKPSSSGSKRDPQLKELNKLLKTLPEGSDDRAKVRAHIDQRTAEINKERAERGIADTRANIDKSALPPNLANMID